MEAEMSSTATTSVKSTRRFPSAAVAWLVVSVLIFLVGNQVVTMRDKERFPDDFQLVAQPTETDNTVRVEVVAGTFAYNVVPQTATPVETGTF